MQSYHIIIKGRVQGVYFRDYTQRQAAFLNIQGWVRNLPNGSVECLITGEDQVTREMIDWLRKGSPMCRVDDIVVTPDSSDKTYSSFDIRY